MSTRIPLPQPALDDVCAAFDRCVERRGYATSLDVKKDLRERGFFATQALVSDALQSLAGPMGWDGQPCVSWEVERARVYGALQQRTVRRGPYLAYWPAATPPTLHAWGQG